MAVGVINTSSIAQKVLFDKLGEISITDALQGSQSADSGDEKPVETDDQKWKKILKDPSEIGVDVLADAFVYFSNDYYQGRPAQIVALFKLSDVKELEAILDDNPPSDLKGETESGKGYKFRYNKEKGMAFGWTDKILALCFADKSAELNPTEELKKVFTDKKNSSIASNEKMKQLMADAPDVGFYLNMKQLDEMIKSSDNSNLNLAMKDNWVSHVTGGMDFDDGEIQLSTTAYAMKGKEEAIAKLTEDVKLGETLNMFYVDNALGFTNLRFDVDNIRNLLMKDEMAKQQLAGFLMGMQMTEDEFFSSMDGSLFIGATGMKTVKKEIITQEMDEEFNTYDVTKVVETSSPQILLALGVDESKMKKMMLGMRKSGIIAEDGEYFRLNAALSMGNDAFASLQDNMLIISTEKETFTNSIDNGGWVNDMAIANPMSMYLNVDEAIDAMGTEQKRQYGPLYENIKSTIADATFTVEGEDGKLKSVFSLKFDDEDSNGLLQLIELIKKSEKMKKQLTM
ncbi:MAG: hypothetical protein ACJAWV_001029 [Flammeovirgaceae bacterium]|jgi:hypothetical protein